MMMLSSHSSACSQPFTTRLLLLAIILATIGTHPSDGGIITEFQPEFSEPIENVTVPLGRDATFTCVVQSLGGYRVGWVRADSKAIQAIHTHVITHNPRVTVSHIDHSVWHLHIKNVKEDDRGSFMCQVNTDPMISQISYLEVVIPPDFISEETSGDLMAPEGSPVKLNCNARGHPSPNIIWKRENGQNITLKTPAGVKSQVASFEGNVLRLHKVSRADMGAYLCIASNGVPPSISKRVMVSVHFHPVIHVPNQLVGAPLNTNVTLECNVEAYPRPIHFWTKDNAGSMIISGDRYEVQELANKSMFEVRMILIIRNFQRRDAGEFHCIAKNSLGDVDSIIKLSELKMSGVDDDDNRRGGGSDTFAYGDSDEDDNGYDIYDNLSGPDRHTGREDRNPQHGNHIPYQPPNENNENSSTGPGNSISNTISSNKAKSMGDKVPKYQLTAKSKNQRPPINPNSGSSNPNTNTNYQQSVVVPVNTGNGKNVRVVGSNSAKNQYITYLSFGLILFSSFV